MFTMNNYEKYFKVENFGKYSQKSLEMLISNSTKLLLSAIIILIGLILMYFLIKLIKRKLKENNKFYFPIIITITKFLYILLLVYGVINIFFFKNYVKENYSKTELTITMRDGVKLHTTIYAPKNKSQTYPILLLRTPYSCSPYGEDEYLEQVGPNKYLMKDGYIFVYQDVRGRWMSEGVFDNMRAYVPNKKSKKEFDESTDTYDTIDWLIENVDNNNGNVGTWGISYPGFYSTFSLIDAHPALKAASPQAPIADFFFDDFHKNGAYMLSYFTATPLFGKIKNQPMDKPWYTFPDLKTQDQYQYFLDNTPLQNLNNILDYRKNKDPLIQNNHLTKDVLWDEIINHPNYDEHWKAKGILPHLKNLNSNIATMVVGGWFDAEDLYGSLETYKTIEKYNTNNNTLVFGPWNHGAWAETKVKNIIGNYYFGDSISEFYQREIETKFFNKYLKNKDIHPSSLPEAYVFDTGLKKWKTYDSWPPSNISKKIMFLSNGQKLTNSKVLDTAITFISDINHPVPYSEDIKITFIPKKFMTDDQRFSARRPDVLVFETDILEDNLTLAGNIVAKLKIATTGTDADWIVKIIDVHPSNVEEPKIAIQDHLKMSNYHMMVRSEVMRGKFRNSFSNPEPFVANKPTEIEIKLQDLFHTFKKGHKLQVQIQSSWFPLIDLNPQTFVPNIYKASKKDFKTQTHTVFTTSTIELPIIK